MTRAINGIAKAPVRPAQNPHDCCRNSPAPLQSAANAQIIWIALSAGRPKENTRYDRVSRESHLPNIPSYHQHPKAGWGFLRLLCLLRILLSLAVGCIRFENRAHIVLLLRRLASLLTRLFLLHRSRSTGRFYFRVSRFASLHRQSWYVK